MASAEKNCNIKSLSFLPKSKASTSKCYDVNVSELLTNEYLNQKSMFSFLKEKSSTSTAITTKSFEQNLVVNCNKKYQDQDFSSLSTELNEGVNDVQNKDKLLRLYLSEINSLQQVTF